MTSTRKSKWVPPDDQDPGGRHETTVKRPAVQPPARISAPGPSRVRPAAPGRAAQAQAPDRLNAGIASSFDYSIFVARVTAPLLARVVIR